MTAKDRVAAGPAGRAWSGGDQALTSPSASREADRPAAPPAGFSRLVPLLIVQTMLTVAALAQDPAIA